MPVPGVLELALLNSPRLHRLGGAIRSTAPDAGHLIDAHRVDPVPGQRRSRLVTCANDLELARKASGSSGLALSQYRLRCGFNAA